MPRSLYLREAGWVLDLLGYYGYSPYWIPGKQVGKLGGRRTYGVKGIYGLKDTLRPLAVGAYPFCILITNKCIHDWTQFCED